MEENKAKPLTGELYSQLKQEENNYLQAIHKGEKYETLRAIRSRISELKKRINDLTKEE